MMKKPKRKAAKAFDPNLAAKSMIDQIAARTERNDKKSDLEKPAPKDRK